MENNNKLKVGDKLCNISHQRWGDNVYYTFDEVERLTKTQAILKSGVKLINEQTKDWNGLYCYMVYGDRYTKWQVQTDELIESAKKEKERQKVNNWFSNQKFNQEQVIQIYNLFNKTN